MQTYALNCSVLAFAKYFKWQTITFKYHMSIYRPFISTCSHLIGNKLRTLNEKALQMERQQFMTNML